MRMPFSLIGQAKFTSSNLDDAGQASLQVITALNIVALYAAICTAAPSM
ncbi:MAG: hypothetical protein O2984_07765 [Bacteroidetes bacterium]|nr:hypothetical protein [Bacteroidota bacterium]